jgi:hypothetical protein
MSAHRLEERWMEAHTRVFLDLKIAITSEPILQGPKWDSMPFIVMIDRCKEGFAGVLAQWSAHMKPDRTVVQKWHPIAFVSKHTSPTKAKYKPFLLEFASLKFMLDKFSDIIWGFPIEIEMDCQALRDTLLSKKPSVVHVCWQDGILAHQIIDVRHIPGKANVVADGLSHQWEDQPEQEEDGHEWTVNLDRDKTVGLTNDILLTQDQEPKKEV